MSQDASNEDEHRGSEQTTAPTVPKSETEDNGAETKLLSEKIKKTVLDLHSKGKTPKQIASHYAVSEENLSEVEIVEIIQSIKGKCLPENLQIR